MYICIYIYIYIYIYIIYVYMYYIYIYIYIYIFQIFRSFLYIVDIYVYITISLDIWSTKSCFNFFRMAVCFFFCHKMCHKGCFIILSKRYHTLLMRYHMSYCIITGNFYNIEQMTFFCAISDVLLFMLPCILKGISTYLYHFQEVTTRYRQFYKKT